MYSPPARGRPPLRRGGGLRVEGTARPGDTGYLLHAMRLALAHPETGEPFEVVCRPPRALRIAIEDEAV